MSGEGGDPIGWLVAHEEIRQLASRYAVALDARDLDSLVSLFVDGGSHINGAPWAPELPHHP